MAGQNKSLKEGQILFSAGDASDGMYLIRRGELRVYLEKDNKEISLATVEAGGMIGEMALFDKQPRSASVKATADNTEVTLISNEDFIKLMKQIPKWFVGLMSTLSTRLRQTNERCQRLENMEGGKPFQITSRLLHILILLWHRDGEKEGKEWMLQKAPVVKAMTEMFGEEPEKVKVFFETLVKQNYFTTRVDSYNNVVLATQNKGRIAAFAEFLNTFVRDNPKLPCLPDGAINMLKALESAANESAYDTLSISIGDLQKIGKRLEYNTADWEASLPAFKKAGDEVKLVKTSGGIGLKTTKKGVAPFIRNHTAIAAFHKSNLG